MTTRLSDNSVTVQTVAAQVWASDFKQIPATVIDVGIMRNVPYKSYLAGGDYEINVYGDPESPAGFEIGVHGPLVNDDQAKQNCIECACKLLGEPADQQVVRAMSMEKDQKVRNGVTFEVTPPSASDAYGSWWVSIYDDHALDAARASDAELKSITVTRNVAVPTVRKRTSETSGESRDMDGSDDWHPQDYRFARATSTASSGAGGRGSVYVRGYTRKNGTYVQPHTRSAPRGGRR
ncbi:MAG: hypothetical protein WCJ35_11865 [Planctomycetota bacterium]